MPHVPKNESTITDCEQAFEQAREAWIEGTDIGKFTEHTGASVQEYYEQAHEHAGSKAQECEAAKNPQLKPSRSR